MKFIEKQNLYFSPSFPMLHPKVRKINFSSLVPHRNNDFTKMMKNIDVLLLKIIGDKNYIPVLLSGNGTLSNEIMVANLNSISKYPGVIINGEFGNRLYQQCLKYNSNTIAIDFGFGQKIDYNQIEKYLKKVDCLFFVALETSAGIVNPVREICNICEKYDIKIGIDAVSAMGALDIDYTSKQIYFVTTSSGKNLASISGVSIIFVRKNYLYPISNTIPYSLDINYLLKGKQMIGLVNNTLSHFLVKALFLSLNEIVNNISIDKYYKKKERFRNIIINTLKDYQIQILENCNASTVLSFYYPSFYEWNLIRKVLEQNLIFVYDEVPYLQDKKIFQIAIMGFFSKNHINALLQAFKKVTEL